jgi:type IV secretory pathway TrbD component
MGPRLIRRRRDGLLEIRRTRARDLVLTSDTVVLSCLLAGWFLFAVLLVITLVWDPPLLGLAAWLIAYFAVEQWKRRPARSRPRRRPRLSLVSSSRPPDSAA